MTLLSHLFNYTALPLSTLCTATYSTDGHFAFLSGYTQSTQSSSFLSMKLATLLLLAAIFNVMRRSELVDHLKKQVTCN